MYCCASGRFRLAFKPLCVVGPVWGFLVDVFASRPKSPRFRNLRPAQDSARHAGHDGANNSLKATTSKPIRDRFAK